MIQYLKSKIGLKLFLSFAAALALCIFFVVILNSYFSSDFRKLIITENESYVKEQALAFLSETTRLQGQKYEAIFQKLSAYSRSNARQVELLLQFNNSPALVDDSSQRLSPDPVNGILYNSQSAPVMFCYWGGSSISPQLANTIRQIAPIATTLEQVTEENPEIVASHLIMSQGYAAYYPNTEDVHLLPPVSELDLRDTNNYVLANPDNNPGQKTVWVPVYFDDTGKGLMTTVTTPIYGKQGSFLGVAGLDITLDSIHKMVSNDEQTVRSFPSQHSISFLLDGRGKFISFPLGSLEDFGIESNLASFKNSFDLLDKGLADSRLPEIRKLEEGVLGTRSQTSRFFLRGEPYISSSVFLPSNGWRLVTVISEESFLSPIKSIAAILVAKVDTLSYQFYLTAVLFLIGSLLVTVIFLRRFLLQPLYQVTQASERIRNGELDIQLDIDRTDEIGKLASTFNVMAESLHKSRLKERDYSNDLKVQVAQKTLELENDIHRRKQVEAELIKEKEKAEAANLAKSNFLANMTHELRTPLIGVLGMNELLLNTPLTEEQKKLAVTVQHSGEILLTLVSDILDFSKIESNNLALRHVPTDVSKITEETTRLLAEQAAQKNLPLSCQISPEARCIVSADPLRLRQVLLNLVSNAVKFTNQGEIVVRLNMLPNGEHAGLFILEIQDTGIGISIKNQKKIFEPFTQIDDATNRKAGGTGLGLAIVRQLVAMMGGKLEVESQVGVGSLFRVRLLLPLADSHNTGDDSIESADLSLSKASGISREDPAGQRGKILVIDDYIVTRELVRHLLSPSGIEIDEASSGQEAIEMIMSNSYDLVLMDCNMPGMDGISASRQLREKGYTVPIVAMTAHVDSRILEDCLAAGMNDCLSKPFRKNDLVKTIDKWLKRTEQ